MDKMRTLLLTLASGSALCPGMVAALGLGEITLYSALNQPLDARIELIDANQLDAGDFKVRLASEQDYARAGVERFYFLNDLRFTPMLSGGERYIRVQSSKNMREPYLNFMVEVVRPNGNLLREYTLLFDPPESAAYRQQAVSLDIAAPRLQPNSSEWSAQGAVPAATRGERYDVRRGDSLWLIARRLRQEGSTLSLQQLMDAMLALNPQAFVGGDPARLRAGVALLLPDEGRPQVEAVSPVPSSPPDTSAPETQPVAVNSLGSQVQSSDERQALEQLQARLDDEVTASQQQNAILTAELQSLGEQLGTLQQALGQRDQQIAELRALLQQNSAAVTAPAAQADSSESLLERSAGQAEPSEDDSASWYGWLVSTLLLGALAVSLVWRGRKAGVPSRAAVPAAIAPVAARPAERQVAATVAAPVSVPQSLTGEARNRDPLAAANVYIAYGNLAEARACLQHALEQDPGRHELRLRLLEVLAQLGDELSFQREQLPLQGVSECAAELLRIRDSFSQSARSDRVEQAPVTPLNESQPLTEEDFKLNLEDVPLDTDWDKLEPFGTLRVPTRETVAVEQISSNLDELPEVSELGHGELAGDLPAAFERRMGLRAADAAAKGNAVLDRDLVGQTLTEFRNFEEVDLSHLDARREHLGVLNRALAFIEQGNLDEACNILNQLINDGNDEQKREAKALLARIA